MLLKYSCFTYTSFMILHMSLVLTFIYYYQVFMVVVDLVMVFCYVSGLCSGYMFQLMGGTYTLHVQGEVVQVGVEVMQRKKCVVL
jgi:hypothetical protein